MTFLYQLAVLGSPTDAQILALEETITQLIGKFNMRLGHEVGFDILPGIFNPPLLQPSAAVFFAGESANIGNLEELLERGIPILPVITNAKTHSQGTPELLQCLQPLSYAEGGAEQVAKALLACVGLLPQHRRVFISFRRDEATAAASQLYQALTALQFDVYLDTHVTANAEGKPVSDKIEAISWHKLYDSDVMVMLDTPGYFESRWTSAEFGRILAKGISVLRVDWPGATPSRRSAIANVSTLTSEDIYPESGQISELALADICAKLEEVRSQNHAVRAVNMISSIRIAIQKIGGKMLGVSISKAVHLQLPNGEHLTVYPAIGVPVPVTLEDALAQSKGQSVAVVYDPVGLNQAGVKHLDWMQESAQSSQWIKTTEASWQFGQWRH